MESNLKLYLDILQRHGITPTFPVTATTLNKHPDLIKKFSDVGVEFAVHAYNHLDYTTMPPEPFSQHIEKAIKTFEKHNISFSGFRFPYLRWDQKCLHLMDNPVFKWDSSQTILWDVLENILLSKKNWSDYQTVLRQYDYKNANSYFSLPRFHNSILEIPVSLPDDDLLFDRLCIRDENMLGQIWNKILVQTYSRGELFTLQLHPERISFFKDTLRSLIRTANNSNPKIWVTSLGKIAEWWNEKKRFSINISKKGNDEYEIHAHCSSNASILVKRKDSKNDNFFRDYGPVYQNNFTIRSFKRPIIGISRECSPALIKFLENEKFIFEISPHRNNYSIFLDGFQTFNEEDEIEILRKIDQTDLPLIRFWRWPNGYRSALAITGDIDALTSADFFLRVFAR